MTPNRDWRKRFYRSQTFIEMANQKLPYSFIASAYRDGPLPQRNRSQFLYKADGCMGYVFQSSCQPVPVMVIRCRRFPAGQYQ